MTLARLSLALTLVVACSSEKKPSAADHAPAPAPDQPAGAPTGAAPATGTPTSAELATGAPAAAGRAEVFHAGDRASMQGFSARQLAVGGGFVYWVNQPRIDAHGLGKTTVERKAAAGGAVETVVPATSIFGIAADDASLYWAAKDGVWSRPHGGGEPRKLAPGAFLDIVAGKTHLLARSKDQLTLIPLAGGAPETIWQGKRGNFHITADGDRFLVVENKGAGKGTLTAYTPGKPPIVLVDGAANGHAGAHGAHVYFAGGGQLPISPPLWRVDREKGGTPEQVGNPDWGFGAFEIANGTLYGMIFTGKWHLQKLPLDGAAQPTVLDALEDFRAMVVSLATDGEHLYYLTDWNVERAPL